MCGVCRYFEVICVMRLFLWLFFFSSRRRHTRCALVTGVQTCALPISLGCLVLRLSGGAQAQVPDPQGPEMTLAQLAAFAIETRRAEQALAEMRQRNELILGAAADGIVGVDADGLVTFANPAAVRLLDRRLEDMIGRSVEEFLRPLHAEIGRAHV